MKRLIAGCILWMVVLAGGGILAADRADAWSIHHIKTVSFYGGEARFLFLHVRSTDQNVHSGVASYAAAMQNLWQYYPALPYPVYVDERGSAASGCASRIGGNHVYICIGEPGYGAFAKSYVHWAIPSNHVDDAYVILRGSQSAAFNYTLVCHEVGHVINLDHYQDDSTCMETQLWPGEDDAEGYNATDIQRLVQLYYSHYPG